MINISVIFFLGLCPFIPLTSHVAEGLIFIGEFWLLFAAGMAGGWIVRYFKIKKQPLLLVYLTMFMATVLYVQAVGCLFPVPVMTVEVYLYIAPLSYILAISIDNGQTKRDWSGLPLAYSLLLFGVSVVRELCVFGTISLPAPTGLWSIRIIPGQLPLQFWGSTAGILILLGIGLWLFRSFQKGELLPFQTDESHRNSV